MDNVTMKLNKPNKEKQIKLIAKRYLGVETFEKRNMDMLDFHDLAVWNIKDALDAAFEAGKKSK